MNVVGVWFNCVFVMVEKCSCVLLLLVMVVNMCGLVWWWNGCFCGLIVKEYNDDVLLCVRCMLLRWVEGLFRVLMNCGWVVCCVLVLFMVWLLVLMLSWVIMVILMGLLLLMEGRWMLGNE